MSKNDNRRRKMNKDTYAKKLAFTHFDMGNKKYEQRFYEEAAKEFSHAIRLDKNFPDAYIKRGESYRAIGEPELALKDFEKVLDILPEDEIPIVLYYFRSIAYADLEDPDNAYINMDFAYNRMKKEREIGLRKNIEFITDHMNRHFVWTQIQKMKKKHHKTEEEKNGKKIKA